MKILPVMALVLCAAVTLSAGERGKKRTPSAEKSESAAIEKDMEVASRLSEESLKDKRHPSKTNVSGVWEQGMNVGTTVRLEQKGQRITGRGFSWGCFGYFDATTVTGTFRDGVLDLVFIKRGEEGKKVRLFYREVDGFPRFEIKEGQEWQMLPGLETAFEREKRRAEMDATFAREKAATEMEMFGVVAVVAMSQSLIPACIR